MLQAKQRLCFALGICDSTFMAPFLDMNEVMLPLVALDAASAAAAAGSGATRLRKCFATLRGIARPHLVATR
jgi:hypothetical protein